MGEFFLDLCGERGEIRGILEGKMVNKLGENRKEIGLRSREEKQRRARRGAETVHGAEKDGFLEVLKTAS